MRFLLQACVLFCSAALASSANAAISTDPLEDLLVHSPFGSSAINPATNLSPEAPLEFRAVLEERGATCFSLFEPTTRQSYWVEANDSLNGVSIKNYDAVTLTLTVDYHGRTVTLPLKGAPATTRDRAALSPPKPIEAKISGLEAYRKRKRFTQAEERYILRVLHQSSPAPETPPPKNSAIPNKP